MIFSFLLLGLAVLATVSKAVIYESFSELPKQSFDFIIVGGGAGGNVVANRLSENPNFSVLLLEAGVSNEGVLNSIVPLFTVFLRTPNPQDWNYTTVPMSGLDGRALHLPRGKLLGGCTSMNGMDYLRGSVDDWNRYARVTSDPGWSWENVQTYFRKNERFTPPAHLNATGRFDPAVHGFHGITSVTLADIPRDTDDRILQTLQEFDDTFPFNLDTNSGFQLGFGWTQSMIKDGGRSSSATSYLSPQFINRPNLHVLLNAQVTRLIQTDSRQGKPTFLTAEFSASAEGARHRVTASEEVILSAGAIGTPQILLSSGIGDTADITPLGITPRVHLPGVGKNLSAHVSTSVIYFVNSTNTFDDAIRNATLRNELLAQWNKTHDGLLANTYPTFQGFTRMPSNVTIFETTPDPAAGPNTGHFLSSISNGDISPPLVGHFISIAVTVSNPTSRGSIRLNTTDPFDQPLIDLACLNTNYDIFALREAVRSTRKFLTASAWDGYLLDALNPPINATTDEELDAFLRANAAPNGHIVATASMSAKDADFGVVDPDLRVKGVEGLRVIDASVLPFLPSGTTTPPLYVVGERGSDLIKED